jgi:pPIWI_RE module N-terminal domain/RNaseH domain of pPIWI_RE/MID domain of pPIWI_RE
MIGDVIMVNNFSDDFEFNEDLSELDEDDVTETNSLSESFYIPLGKPKSVKRFPLAFTIPDDLPTVLVEGYTLAWTKVALGNLAAIQKGNRTDGQKNVKNLPYASLRGLLEVGLKNLARLDSHSGLSPFALNSKITSEPEPFAYLVDDSLEAIKKSLQTILDNWITNFLRPYAKREQIPEEILDRLEELGENEEIFQIIPFKYQALPWPWSEQTGTTNPDTRKSKYLYRVLADHVVRQIAGKEIFHSLGPMKRIISSGGGLTSGVAELITKPISITDKPEKGTFSLVVRLEVITYPSLHQPLLKIDVSKRRWISQLKSPEFDRNDISGFVFSQDHPDRAFSYRVVCKKDDNKNWQWTTDKDFEALRRELRLKAQTFGGQDIALGKANDNNNTVVLTYRNGLQDGAKEYGIKAGVPETDKLEAFEAIANILEPIGLRPFEKYLLVKSRHGKPDDTASRMINLPTLLGACLEAIETNCSLKFTSKYLKKFDNIQLNSLLCKHFDISLENIYQGRKSLQFGNSESQEQTEKLVAMIRANQEALRRLYPNERLLLIIFYENELQTEMKLLEAIIRVLWGETIEFLVTRLPANTHGPRVALPGKELKANERSECRREAWQPIVEQLAVREQRTFCLIMAREFYPDPKGQNNSKHDDRVNKPSTRQALAAMAGSCVQFVLPIEKTQATKLFKLEDFFHRVQAALKDLLSAHSGRIDGVQEKVDKYLKDIPREARPKEILAITIVRKQRGRVRGPIKDTFLAVAMRLKVDTGKCELCCAYDKGNTLAISPWSSFSDAIAFIAQLSPVKLGDKNEVRKTRFMEFVKQIISNSVEEGAQPLVMIDSSNCVQLWSWLADIRINANEINFEQMYQWMEQEWQGARIVRIRQDLAPGIIDQKERLLAETSLEDTRSKEELKKLPSILKLPSASDARGLFRLTATNQTGCVAYLSVGRKTLHQYTRGQSCYRPMQINTPVTLKKDDGSREKVLNQAGLEVHQVSEKPPFLDQWPTPNPLEIVVTLRQPQDDPDCIASLVESLRYSFGHYSEWTVLPAPLFFERVVRDYISEFAIKDEDTEGEADF